MDSTKTHSAENERNSVLFFSRFVLNENAGGGCRRETQLGEALKPLDYKFISWRDSDSFLRRMGLRDRFLDRTGRFLHPFGLYWDRAFVDQAWNMKSATLEWKRYADRCPDVRLAIIDDPIFFYPLVEHFHERGIPVVALCQNIESLSFNQVDGSRQARLFSREISVLKKCKLVVTISREETFLLKNFNIPAYFFPYHPVRSIEDRMKRVRDNRRHTDKSDFLLLGTVGNMVTLEGMKTFIEFWNRRDAEDGMTLLVGGYGTPKYLGGKSTELVRYIGALSNEELDQTLSTIRAFICFQEFGAGDLTKIKEMMIAGVPVLASSHAARSYYGSRGVIEFSGLGDFDKAVDALNRLQDAPHHEDEILIPDADELVGRIREVLE
jgi:glycosyltransferase involved in cell wall biosynthesis